MSLDEISEALHALQSPLTVLRARLEKARETEDAGALHTVLDECVREVDEMTGVLTGLLLLGKSDARALASEGHAIALNVLARETALRWAPVAEAKQVQLTVSEEAIRVRGSERLLLQLLSALVDNALKHTPEGGAVAIEVKEEAGAACLTVADTGAGIPEDARSRVFERFYQFDRERARAQGGVGLGLSISKAITEAHGGSLEIWSAPGRGTRVTLRLPLLRRGPTPDALG